MKIEIKERTDGKIIVITYENGNTVYVRAFENESINVNFSDSQIQMRCSAANDVTLLPR